ncbi:MAG: hypothetical protein QW808_03605, partial [Desulfurococcaceae archaeon]
MELFNCLEILNEIDNETLLKSVNLVVNPPTIKEELSTAIIHKYEIPQPTAEYIRVEDLEKLLGRKALDIFVCLDQAISLRPELLKKSAEGEQLPEIFREHIEEMVKTAKIIEGLKSNDLKSEDEEKKEIMFTIPSEKQMAVVKGDWDKWLWGKITYDYDETPNVSALASELANFALVLRKEGIKVDVIADSFIYNDIREKVGSETIELDIPPNLPNVLYVRDPSVVWFKHPVIGSMVLEPRRGEEAVAALSFRKLGLTPLLRIQWVHEKRMLFKAYMEGGNFFVIKTDGGVAVFTGIGVRGSNWATFKALSSILPEDVRIIGIPLSGYIRDWATGATHLDGRFSYLGETKGVRVALVDPSKIALYSALEYDRQRGSFKLIEML